ncbi:MAG: M20/M25/M40 family metallo-hydrolase [Chloroflexi bacterium]|nr:M20/M25/M40 family metallo-hydrolase [Chloroflexota bacterium]
MTYFARRLLLLALAALLLAACGGDQHPAAVATAPASTPTATVTSTPTPMPPTPTPESTPKAAPFGVLDLSEPDVDRAYEDMRALVEDIGIRTAGTEEEREAAAYIAAQLREAGYVVQLEEFETSYRGDHSTLATVGEGPSMQALALAGSRNGTASGPLVHAGLGSPEAFRDTDVDGAIALLDRGLIPFRDKARAAQDAGAIGVVIVNSEPGLFGGTLGELAGVTIPVIGVRGQAREALRALAEDGTPVTVTADVGSRSLTSQNVVGRNGECRGYLGAHYDTVPYGPGANDNASGTALIIELARTHRAEGLCVIAFGAEEVGLHGSQAFVDAHDVSDALFLLNFDMVARIGQRANDGPRFIPSTAALSARAADVADRLGYGILPGDFPLGAASDHVIFEEAGVPAITVHSGGSEFIHTSMDTIDTVFRDDLAIFLEVSSELLRELLAEPGG